MNYPKISIITPSYNQGQYIEETILSVIGQNYPNLEYIIIDGGSTDNSVEIIKKYEKYLTYWVSEPDTGQSDAINKGFNIASGDILGWLNSDDLYLPGTLLFVVQNLNHQKEELLFGNAIHIVEQTPFASGSPSTEWFHKLDISYIDYITQPSSFWTKKAWEKAGNLRLNLHYALDWEWFIRAYRNGVQFIKKDKHLSVYRIHGEHKTSNGGEKRQQEILDIYKQYQSEQIYKLCETMNTNATSITKVKQRIRKYKMSRIKNKALKLLFPKIYRNRADVTDAISIMLGIPL
jgi:glycosyltransferase involved in cell wall biosynthesis